MLLSEVESFFASLHAPGANAVTDAADVTVSPDGTFAAITGMIYNDLKSPPTTRICLIKLSDGALRVLDSGAGDSRLPLWSGDGKHLGFLSDRAERGRFLLCLTDANGSADEMHECSVDGSIDYFHWSPDSRGLLLGVVNSNVRRLHVYDIESRIVRQISPPDLCVWEASWLGTDHAVAVVSSSHSESAWYQSRLVVLSLTNGSIRELYQPQDQIGVPMASPSGRRVALLEALCSDRTMVTGQLLIIDAENATVRALDTASVDVTDMKWRDDQNLCFAGLRGLQTVVGEIEVDRGSLVELWSSRDFTLGRVRPSIAPISDGGCAAIGESYDTAPELAVVTRERYRPIRSFAASSTITAESIEPLFWTARDGLEMQGWLVKPPGPGPFPLVVDLHGGPVECARNVWQGRLRACALLARHGVASVYPNPRGSSGRGQHFARQVQRDMGGEDGWDCLGAIDALIERGVAISDRLGITGLSYGGFLTAWLITQTTRFAAAVPISCVANWITQHQTSDIPGFDELFIADVQHLNRSPVTFAHQVNTPTLQIVGGRDKSTPPAQAWELHESLRRHGVTADLAFYPQAGHGVRDFPDVIDATTRCVAWLLERLKP